MSTLILKDFGGVPEITPQANELKAEALALSKPILKVDSANDQAGAVAALQRLKAIRTGMESTRKAIKAPVIELGKAIDTLAANFLQEADREEMRLQGLINHYQRKLLEEQRAEEARLQRERDEAARLEEQARRLHEEAEKKQDAELAKQATAIEEKVLDAKMESELAPMPLAPTKPRGLVVKSRLNFQIENAIIFCQAFPQFFTWNAETETLKVKRREILDELNREDGKGIFHNSRYPEELPDHKESRISKPAGMRVYEETKSHVR